MTPVATEVTSCRACHYPGLGARIIDFGEPYISAFVRPMEPGIRAPLEVVYCTFCGLAQLRHTVDRDLLYRDAYWYRSGTNETMVKALRDVVEHARRLVDLRPGDRVLDIGANDGTLLRAYPDHVRPWAVEPSAQLHDDYLLGLPNVVAEFWPVPYRISAQPFKIVTSIACFYDTDDPGAFVDAIREHLADDGIWICQMQDAGSVVRANAFDYWCHEHLCLWSTEAFSNFVQAHGMYVDDMVGVPINGGSMRYILRKSTTPVPMLPADHTHAMWNKFGKRIADLKQDALSLLWRLHDEGYTVLGAAASTKANTVLQYYGIDSRLITAIAERAPEKVGRHTVGSDIPIISEEYAAALNPDYYVALAWQFLEGLRQRAPHVPFITLLPEVKIWPALVPQGRPVAAAST